MFLQDQEGDEADDRAAAQRQDQDDHGHRRPRPDGALRGQGVQDDQGAFLILGPEEYFFCTLIHLFRHL